MRTNGLCRNVHEGSPGDKHSTRVKVESGGNWQIQQDVESGWPRFTGWLELALAGEAIPAGVPNGAMRLPPPGPSKSDLSLKTPVSATGVSDRWTKPREPTRLFASAQRLESAAAVRANGSVNWL